MTEIQPARKELLALADAARGRDWAVRLASALSAAATNGWPWERAGLYAARLIFTPGSEPRDLLNAARGPLARPGHLRVPPTADFRAIKDAIAESAGRPDDGTQQQGGAA